jgi:hypothetical protein
MSRVLIAACFMQVAPRMRACSFETFTEFQRSPELYTADDQTLEMCILCWPNALPFYVKLLVAQYSRIVLPHE